MFLYVIENKVNNLKIGEKYFTSRVVLDFNQGNGIFENRLKFFNNCFEDAGLFETKFKSFVFLMVFFLILLKSPKRNVCLLQGVIAKSLT